MSLPLFLQASISHSRLVTEPKGVRKIVLILFFIVMAVTGAAAILFSVKDYRASLLSKTWPTVFATALGEGREGLMRVQGTHYVYYAEGTTWTGKRVRFFTNNRLVNPAPAQVFKTGERILIHVQPGKAHQSVVIAGGQGQGFLLFLIAASGLLFTGLGGVIRIISSSGK